MSFSDAINLNHDDEEAYPAQNVMYNTQEKIGPTDPDLQKRMTKMLERQSKLKQFMDWEDDGGARKYSEIKELPVPERPTFKGISDETRVKGTPWSILKHHINDETFRKAFTVGLSNKDQVTLFNLSQAQC